jgi:hypothetical protein
MRFVTELFRNKIKRKQTRGFIDRSCPSHFIVTNPNATRIHVFLGYMHNVCLAS